MFPFRFLPHLHMQEKGLALLFRFVLLSQRGMGQMYCHGMDIISICVTVDQVTNTYDQLESNLSLNVSIAFGHSETKSSPVWTALSFRLMETHFAHICTAPKPTQVSPAHQLCLATVQDMLQARHALFSQRHASAHSWYVTHLFTLHDKRWNHYCQCAFLSLMLPVFPRAAVSNGISPTRCQ